MSERKPVPEQPAPPRLVLSPSFPPYAPENSEPVEAFTEIDRFLIALDRHTESPLRRGWKLNQPIDPFDETFRTVAMPQAHYDEMRRESQAYRELRRAFDMLRGVAQERENARQAAVRTLEHFKREKMRFAD